MSQTENIGHALTPQVVDTKRRGNPEKTKEDMEKLFPTIHVAGVKTEVRKRKLHDYRNNTPSDNVERWRCNLCGLDYHAPIHQF